ncbi:hypothetical protein [Pigmentiphaga kullae]|uniref:hypothetical protein n=1 Tax=Pigmentiphaga kullae TaxID=151784 RepID=UPI001F5E7663|nr:hypothetical protein [Pigmentiphaga kullae]
MSVAMVNGRATGGVPEEPARPPRSVPRVRPHQSCLLASVAALALSACGSGALPSAVWPYQILLMVRA